MQPQFWSPKTLLHIRPVFEYSTEYGVAELQKPLSPEHRHHGYYISCDAYDKFVAARWMKGNDDFMTFDLSQSKKSRIDR